MRELSLRADQGGPPLGGSSSHSLDAWMYLPKGMEGVWCMVCVGVSEREQGGGAGLDLKAGTYFKLLV